MKILKIIKLIPCFWLPLLVFLIHLVIVLNFDIYTIYDWFDIPMHFIGGASIAFSFICVLKKCREEIIIKDILVSIVILVALVGLVAIFWEFGECIFHFQGDLNDTLFDFVMGLSGGLFVSLILGRSVIVK